MLPFSPLFPVLSSFPFPFWIFLLCLGFFSCVLYFPFVLFSFHFVSHFFAVCLSVLCFIYFSPVFSFSSPVPRLSPSMTRWMNFCFSSFVLFPARLVGLFPSSFRLGRPLHSSRFVTGCVCLALLFLCCRLFVLAFRSCSFVCS